jgi:hypothetical protein
VWFNELVAPDEVGFESDVFLLTKAKAKAAKAGETSAPPEPAQPPAVGPITPGPEPSPGAPTEPAPTSAGKTIRIFGTLPPEVWNRLGTKLLPKLKSGTELKVGVDFAVKVVKRPERLRDDTLSPPRHSAFGVLEQGVAIFCRSCR